jgi:hypothetical protein
MRGKGPKHHSWRFGFCLVKGAARGAPELTAENQINSGIHHQRASSLMDATN